MTCRIITELADDLDGSSEGDVQTVHYAFDGVVYEIDLSREHREELHAALNRYIARSRRVARTRVRTTAMQVPSVAQRVPARRDPEQMAAIRRWAAANGWPVSARGRIPDSVAAAFEEAHQVPA